MQKKSIIKFIILIILIFLLIYIFRFSEYANYFSFENIKEFVESFGFLSFIIFILIYSIGTLVSIPGVILTFVGAVLFGTWLGTLLNLLGATIGAGISFYASRFLGRGFVESLLKGKFKKLDQMICDNAFKGILFVRLIPVFPFIGINYGAGLCQINFKDYITATFIGMIPGTFVYTYLFATIGEKALKDGFSFKDLLTVEFMIPIILFIMLLLIPIFYRKKR